MSASWYMVTRQPSLQKCDVFLVLLSVIVLVPDATSAPGRDEYTAKKSSKTRSPYLTISQKKKINLFDHLKKEQPGDA